MSHTMSRSRALPGGRLELIPIDEGRWRLCDGRAQRSDASYVVAYIEEVDDGLDVVWLRGGRLPARFAHIDEVTAVATRIVAEGDSRGSTRPVPIPHHAPPRH